MEDKTWFCKYCFEGMTDSEVEIADRYWYMMEQATRCMHCDSRHSQLLELDNFPSYREYEEKPEWVSQERWDQIFGRDEEE